MTLAAVADGDLWWRDRAACKKAPMDLVDEAFRRPGGPAAETFKARYCLSICTVAADCLDEAMTSDRHEFGVWGGTSPHIRTRHGAPRATLHGDRRPPPAP